MHLPVWPTLAGGSNNATYSEYAYAQHQTLWNFGFIGIILLPW